MTTQPHKVNQWIVFAPRLGGQRGSWIIATDLRLFRVLRTRLVLRDFRRRLAGSKSRWQRRTRRCWLGSRLHRRRRIFFALSCGGLAVADPLGRRHSAQQRFGPVVDVQQPVKKTSPPLQDLARNLNQPARRPFIAPARRRPWRRWLAGFPLGSATTSSSPRSPRTWTSRAASP